MASLMSVLGGWFPKQKYSYQAFCYELNKFGKTVYDARKHINKVKIEAITDKASFSKSRYSVRVTFENEKTSTYNLFRKEFGFTKSNGFNKDDQLISRYKTPGEVIDRLDEINEWFASKGYN